MDIWTFIKGDIWQKIFLSGRHLSYTDAFLPILPTAQIIVLVGWHIDNGGCDSYLSADKKGKAMLYQDDGLTTRERELVILIARGMVVKEIARLLHVSEKTVRNHLSNIYHKLAVYDRSQVVIYALKKGLIDLQSL